MKKEERIARQKRLARAIQVREAQRRRRARLKSENQKFLQIIVSDALREMIFDYGNQNNLTLQEAAVVLIEKGLQIGEELTPQILPANGEGIFETVEIAQGNGEVSAVHEMPATVPAPVTAPAEETLAAAPANDTEEAQLSLF